MPRKNNGFVHQPFRFTTPCTQKRRFATERKARETAEYQMLVQPNLELSVYKCDVCGGWHLTRQIRRK